MSTLTQFNAAKDDAAQKATVLLAALARSDTEFKAALAAYNAAQALAVSEWQSVIDANPAAALAWDREQQRRFEAHQECGVAPGVGLGLAQRLQILRRETALAGS
jgi:hypothetical protein